MTRM